MQRLIRILVYEGTPEALQHTLSTRAVKGSYIAKNIRIKEAIVGDFLESVLRPTIICESDDATPGPD